MVAGSCFFKQEPAG